MASSTSVALIRLPILAALLLALMICSPRLAAGCYTSIFAFGDSMTETGNYLFSNGENSTHVAFLPYGETYFHRPTGRYSDGRIIVDFLAEAFGLPLLRPYLAGPGDDGFWQGADFAFAGATALDGAFFVDRGMEVFTNNSLRVQLEWLKQLLPSLCSSRRECRQFLQGALFVVGEIGGNDYNHPLSYSRTSIDELNSFVPKVVHAIGSTVEALIELGARTVVVPGTYPIGCMPIHLTEFQGLGDGVYDQSTGCIKDLNDFSEHHNRYLQDELNRIQRLNPRATIIYADYYESVMSLIRSAKQFGFEGATLIACCGAGGPYNYNPSIDCACLGSKACGDPSKRIYWDGYHLTEAANRIITATLLDGPHASPPIAQACPYILSKQHVPQYSY